MVQDRAILIMADQQEVI